MEKFAVIDTETNWHDKVMSIGVVIADAKTRKKIDSVYYIIDPEYRVGGMYSLELRPDAEAVHITNRKHIMLFWMRGMNWKLCNCWDMRSGHMILPVSRIT